MSELLENIQPQSVKQLMNGQLSRYTKEQKAYRELGYLLEMVIKRIPEDEVENRAVPNKKLLDDFLKKPVYDEVDMLTLIRKHYPKKYEIWSYHNDPDPETIPQAVVDDLMKARQVFATDNSVMSKIRKNTAGQELHETIIEDYPDPPEGIDTIPNPPEELVSSQYVYSSPAPELELPTLQTIETSHIPAPEILRSDIQESDNPSTERNELAVQTDEPYMNDLDITEEYDEDDEIMPALVTDAGVQTEGILPSATSSVTPQPLALTVQFLLNMKPDGTYSVAQVGKKVPAKRTVHKVDGLSLVQIQNRVNKGEDITPNQKKWLNNKVLYSKNKVSSDGAFYETSKTSVYKEPESAVSTVITRRRVENTSDLPPVTKPKVILESMADTPSRRRSSFLPRA